MMITDRILLLPLLACLIVTVSGSDPAPHELTVKEVTVTFDGSEESIPTQQDVQDSFDAFADANYGSGVVATDIEEVADGSGRRDRKLYFSISYRLRLYLRFCGSCPGINDYQHGRKLLPKRLEDAGRRLVDAEIDADKAAKLSLAVDILVSSTPETLSDEVNAAVDCANAEIRLDDLTDLHARATASLQGSKVELVDMRSSLADATPGAEKKSIQADIGDMKDVIGKMNAKLAKISHGLAAAKPKMDECVASGVDVVSVLGPGIKIAVAGIEKENAESASERL